MKALVFLQDQALSTFNFLNSEHRYVAGAMIPPSYVDSLNNEELYSNLLDKHLSEEEKNYMFDDFTHKTDKPDFPTLGMDETKKELKKFIDSKVRSVPQNKPQQKGKDEYDG